MRGAGLGGVVRGGGGGGVRWGRGQASEPGRREEWECTRPGRAGLPWWRHATSGGRLGEERDRRGMQRAGWDTSLLHSTQSGLVIGRRAPECRGPWMWAKGCPPCGRLLLLLRSEDRTAPSARLRRHSACHRCGTVWTQAATVLYSKPAHCDRRTGTSGPDGSGAGTPCSPQGRSHLVPPARSSEPTPRLSHPILNINDLLHVASPAQPSVADGATVQHLCV
ncbi:hypothetical protein CALCODRAFT_39876 [Calocera cornea HHB12733]|uniref:Uncharacterized protein n=1 Tax=Calocera cornea HHB12733 TaxID=1353952 RepID=A0A165DXJ2_9BASI|nr:hypothetical protein CALCODRAFT_39876 [Calocera cornea HHB12733]